MTTNRQRLSPVTMKANDIVKLTNPQPGEESARYVLLDDPEPGELVDIQFICDLSIPPIETVSLEEIEPVK